jgi:hypothetical protein
MPMIVEAPGRLRTKMGCPFAGRHSKVTRFVFDQAQGAVPFGQPEDIAQGGLHGLDHCRRIHDPTHTSFYLGIRHGCSWPGTPHVDGMSDWRRLSKHGMFIGQKPPVNLAVLLVCSAVQSFSAASLRVKGNDSDFARPRRAR